MAMTAKERQQALGLAIGLAIAGAVLFWMYWRAPRIEQQELLRGQIDSLTAQLDSARADLATGTVESIRQRSADFEVTLERMKELVPTGNDVNALIDDIATRARRNGVEIITITPMGEEQAVPFNISRSRWVVVGEYNAIGVMMSDIAQLSRIMVPYDVSLNSVDEDGAMGEGGQTDESTSQVRAEFLIRTFVKPLQAVESEGGGGDDR